MDLVLGALIGAAATLTISVIQRRWSKQDEAAMSVKIKSQRADQRSEEAAGQIVDLADLLREGFYERMADGYINNDGPVGSPDLERAIVSQAARLTSQEARERIETATYVAGSAEAIQYRTGNQQGQIGWRVGKEIREVAGAILRNEPIPPCLIEDFVEVWELLGQYD
ncbi:MAG: hypothetical protein WA860_04705 [Acidimicrobiales bacterium]